MTKPDGTQSFENADALMRHALTAFPDGQVEQDNEGQYYVYTNLKDGPDGTIIPFDPDYIP